VITVWIVVQATLVFLVNMNDHLEGAFRQVLAGVLLLASAGMLVAAFVLWGWVSGVVAILATVAYSAMIRGLAARAAQSIAARK